MPHRATLLRYEIDAGCWMLDGGISVIFTHRLYPPMVNLPILPYCDIGASLYALD